MIRVLWSVFVNQAIDYLIFFDESLPFDKHYLQVVVSAPNGGMHKILQDIFYANYCFQLHSSDLPFFLKSYCSFHSCKKTGLRQGLQNGTILTENKRAVSGCQILLPIFVLAVLSAILAYHNIQI